MTVYPITVNVPRAVYEQIKRAAQKRRRPIDELFVEAIVAAAPFLGNVSPGINVPLAQMTYLNDAALWQASRSTEA